jgi:hypothetical protein
MDASIYFRLTDRIELAQSTKELAAVESEIDRAQPHPMERRALTKRIRSRESWLLDRLAGSRDAGRRAAIDTTHAAPAFAG